MARSSRGSKKGQLWRGYRRPILRDGAFWLAALVTVVALAAQNAWSGVDGGAQWALLIADVVVTTLITFALIGVLAGTLRGFGEGWRSAGRPDPVAAPAGASDEASDPGAKPASKPKPTVDPVPEAERPVIGVELEKKARALGRAIGASQRKARKT